MDISLHYMVLVNDGDNKVPVMKAISMGSIASMGATSMPIDIEKRFPEAKGCRDKLARPAKEVELLNGMDNQGWMPCHIEDSLVDRDNLRTSLHTDGKRQGGGPG
jgi:hypothetical protein